jgi:hypothetical protein
VRHHSEGPIFIRYAEQPWGPWARPRILFAAGDMKTGSGQYGPGGLLHHARCKEATCAPSEPVSAGTVDENGRLYGRSIIDAVDSGTLRSERRPLLKHVDLKPVSVVLMKTNLPALDGALSASQTVSQASEPDLHLLSPMADAHPAGSDVHGAVEPERALGNSSGSATCQQRPSIAITARTDRGTVIR